MDATFTLGFLHWSIGAKQLVEPAGGSEGINGEMSVI